MSSFPTNGDYVQALQNTDLCFHDSELKAGRVELTELGMPKAISGNFASVFSVTSSSGKRYAVKCFTREVKGQHRRYEAVHESLARLEGPWRVGFDYIGQGVLVEGKWRAILRMEWVENSQTLIPWLESNLGNPELILDVARQFAAFIEDLQQAGLAHGDLQHGNLLIDSHRKLRVIDYDGMFVPAIKDLGSNELGLANYQHPRRSGSDFGPHLDRFSAWLIYGCLLSLAAQPGLWWTFRDSGDEKLLLGKDDFLFPLTTLERLGSLGSPHSEFVDVLTQSLTPSITIEDVTEFDRSRLPLPALGQTPHQGVSVPSDWWREQVDAPNATATDQAAVVIPPGTDWLKAHEPLPPPIEIVGPSRAAKALSLVMSTVAILGAVALVTRSQIVLSGLVLLTWAAAMTAGVFTLWGRSDALAGRTAARRQLKLGDREVNAQKAEVSKAQKARAALAGAERKELQKLGDQRSKLPQASKSEVEKQSKDLLKKMTASQGALNRVDSTKSAEVSRQLKDVQAQHIQAYLASCRIEPGVIPGIGPALVTALAVHGLQTAADFAGFRDNEFRKNGSNYWFTVSGIGPTKSDAIYGWHCRQMSIAQGRAPLSLTGQQMNAIDNTFAAQKRQHQASIDSLTKQLQTVKASADLKYNAQDREIAQKMDAVRLDYKQRRLVSDTATTQAEIELQRRENALLDAQRELARYQAVSISAYLKA
jgi:hypothetical protein